MSVFPSLQMSMFNIDRWSILSILLLLNLHVAIASDRESLSPDLPIGCLAAEGCFGGQDTGFTYEESVAPSLTTRDAT